MGFPFFNYKRAVARRARQTLSPGEQVVCVHLCRPWGTLGADLAEGLGGAVPVIGHLAGGIAKAVLDSGRERPTGIAAGFPDGLVFVAVTSARVVIYRKAGMYRMVPRFAVAYAPHEITEMTLEQGAMYRVGLHFPDGSGVWLQVAAGQVSARRLLTAWTALKTPPSP
ncbi:hypothetical protein I6A84_20110 [Frankia sp. CNm7]|uniref:Uncharacterized protein n=1 Tax=Frankia nepalensis TaxID=1836974 RepID=A0A937USB5_9ACTN|nr:hypothetical protein [Frankia nepalensis]MBL7495636.1 hypothetical protein [Frankia nepalensis]MBL7508882.1 hypothetical protein [Frankia nepalensis]MBL7520330.1 hypothetical protein [Frankia nepalensis]MBL7630105.1 hypothetical protein [Frankia nepalensis]